MNKRTFEFIKDGEVIDTFEAVNHLDMEMLLVLKDYADKKGVIVKEVK